MPSLVRRNGGIVLGVPVAHRPRIAGTSKYRILDRLLVGVSDVLGVMWLLRRAPMQGAVDEINAPSREPKRAAGKTTAGKKMTPAKKKDVTKTVKKASDKPKLAKGNAR